MGFLAGNIGALSARPAVGVLPSALFAGGAGGAWLDPSDLTTLFQERTGASATTASGVGDPVGTVLDKSGNSNHGIAPSDDARPVLQKDSAGHYYLAFDGTDDQLDMASLAGGAATTFAIALDCTGNIALFDGDGASDIGCILAASSTSTSIFLNGTTVTAAFINVDGIAASYTQGVTQRQDIHALITGAPHVVTFQMAANNWTNTSISGYASYRINGKFYGAVVVDEAISAAHLAQLQYFLATRF